MMSQMGLLQTVTGPKGDPMQGQAGCRRARLESVDLTPEEHRATAAKAPEVTGGESLTTSRLTTCDRHSDVLAPDPIETRLGSRCNGTRLGSG